MVILSQVLYYFEFQHALGDRARHRRRGRHWIASFNEISQHNWDQAAFIILMILVTVAIIDALIVTASVSLSSAGPESTRR